uniref:Uncharacterized protein n=1 Tax=Panagrolaimus sp. ES5 TaxID=591445 RepID=A0AC34GHY4_9BILA
MPKVKKDKKASTTSSSSTGPILLKDLQWDNRKKLWRTSDRRRQWSSFKDKQLNNGGTYRLKGDLSVKIPLPDLFSDDLYDPGTSNITSLLLHRIQSCDLETLHLENQNITFNEYLKLTASKNISMLFFDFVKITDEDGTVVSVDRIMAQLPKIRRIEM